MVAMMLTSLRPTSQGQARQPANGLHVLVLVDECLNRFRKRVCEDPHPGMGAALQQKVQFFFGDFRPSEDVERETFGFQEDGELRIHGVKDGVMERRLVVVGVS